MADQLDTSDEGFDQKIVRFREDPEIHYYDPESSFEEEEVVIDVQKEVNKDINSSDKALDGKVSSAAGQQVSGSSQDTAQANKSLSVKDKAEDVDESSEAQLQGQSRRDAAQNAGRNEAADGAHSADDNNN